MKKRIAIVLIIILSFNLIGCNSKEKKKEEEYQQAVNSFREGDFETAYPIMKSLVKENYLQSRQYVLAMDTIPKLIGTWEGNASQDRTYSAVTCTIGAPFSIGTSKYSDYDWSLKANVVINVERHGVAGDQFFKIVDDGEFGHRPNIYKLSKYVIIEHDKAGQFIFSPSPGSTYSTVTIEPKDDGTLELCEFQESYDRSTIHNTNKMSLKKK